jgi:hypothetical protein
LCVENSTLAVGFDLACAEQLEILEQKEKADELIYHARINGVPIENTTDGEDIEKLRNQGAEVW